MNALCRSSIAELAGTFTLTFIGAGTIISTAAGSGGGLVAIALAHGLALAMAVYATGHISGGHINPAVTIAMLATRRISLGHAVVYILSQLAGAVLGAFLLNQLFPAEAVEKAHLGATLALDPTGASVLASPKIIIVEAILTFLLLTTIFAVAVDKKGPKNIYGFAIGLTICFNILCAGALTGASMNPARSFGPALVGGHWTDHFAYWLGPILGALVAAFVYDTCLASKEKEGEK